MFTPAEMSEVDIFVYDEQVEAVAQAVARLGVMHLAEEKALGQWATGGDNEWTGRANQYNNQERRVLDLMAQLGIEEKPGVCPERLDPREDVGRIERDLQEIEGRMGKLREREADLRRALDRWHLVARSMERLAPIWISLSELRQLEHLHLVAGTIPTENIARLEASLFRIPYTIIPVHRYGDRSLVFAFCAQEHGPILDRALDSAFLEPLSLPEEFSGTAQEVLEQVIIEEGRGQDDLDEVHAGYRAIAREVASNLLAMLVRIRGDLAVAEAMAHLGHREHVYLIAGWVPKNRMAELRSVVEVASHGRATIEENPPEALGDSRQVPTLLRNPHALQGVEGLVATYGLPGYREIDPTPLVGLTFVLMFGMMFGDLGHGLVLVLAGAVLALGLLPSLGDRVGIGLVLLACGLSSSLFGVLYGSVFGMEDVVQHLWLKPMRDIPTLLLSAVAFGVVVLNIGYACRLATALRQRALGEAVFDKNGIVGFLLYWALGAIALLALTGRHVPGALYVVVLTLIVALFLSEPLTNLVRGRRPLTHGSPLELAVQSFFEVFEALIGYISNTLSYVRLGAFAVAHAGLSMVIFILADMLGSGPGLSPIRLAVIMVGNVAVIGFEGLIVAIQTLRLEYYELFGKFYTGGGIPFKPLALPDVECETMART
jgi:V/A-type H+-transporting ATPase subunit I